MSDPLVITEPLGLPVPAAWLLGLKVFGFLLHMIFMNLWLAGLPTALALLKYKPDVALKLLSAMPFFMAFGINAGIVPLLFLQTLYPEFFYPATILQAWFWFLIIPLLIVAYYAVYLASFGRWRVICTVVASLLLLWIGMTFSAAMNLTTSVGEWPAIFLAQADAGAVGGRFLYLNAETMLRFAMMLGMAFGTVAAYLSLDTEWSAVDPSERAALRRCVFALYLLGLALYGAAGSVYATTTSQTLSPIWRLLAGGTMPIAALIGIAYWRLGGKPAAAVFSAAHFLVLLFNAIARQIVQVNELGAWVALEKIPVRGEWGSFALFAVTLAVVLVVMAWMARVTVRALRPRLDE